jgi:hypothetical protein
MSLDVPPTSPPRTQPPSAFDSGGEVPSEYDVFCEACGYSLAGIVADRCPECGRAYDPAELPFARIPWLHRARIGRLRAYWATVRMILFHPWRFALELCRPVRISAADARLFRRVTLRIALLSALLTVVTVVGMQLTQFTPRLSAEAIIVPALVTLTGVVAFAVFLVLATDMPLFIWKGLPSRPPTELAPVHHYAAAPLALTPLLALIIVGASAVIRFMPEGFGFLAGLGVTVAVAALALTIWIVPLVLMRGATRCRAGRVVALAVYLPIHWFLIAVMTGLGFGVVMGILGTFISGIL